MAEQADDQADDQAQRKAHELSEKWLKKIKERRTKEAKWRTQAREVLDRYRDDRTVDDQMSKLNILWANTEVIKPAIFSRMPVPDVRRRYLTQDPAARTAALILERALSYCSSTYNFQDTLDRVNEDYVLPGRAVAVVCYEPLILERQTRQAVEPLPQDDENKDDTASSEPVAPAYPEGTQFDDQGAYTRGAEEYKAWETVYCEYVRWDLFGFEDGSQWSEVPSAWIGKYLTRDDAKRAYPQFKDWTDLPWQAGETNDYDKDRTHQPPGTCLFWKVWHKASRTFMVFCEGYAESPIFMEKDPLQLEAFFPMPEPLYALRTNDTWCPKPEFLLYQDQANELDDVANRLKNLINALKNRGVYDQAMDQVAKISDLTKAPDNTYKPVPNFRELAEKGGLEALISSLPLEQISKVIEGLREREQELKQEIYEIYGIADIMRGASDSQETLGAQELKAQYGGLRISTRQNRFQRFIRDILRMKAEIIAEHFSPDTLRLMCGIQVVPDPVFAQMKQQQGLPAGSVSQSEFDQAIEIIRSDKLRGFKVDVETDSTIPVNMRSEQQNRVQFIQALGQYLQGIIPAVQQGAIPIKVAREVMLFVVRGFKVGTELEEVLEELGEDGDSAQQLQQLQQMNEQLQQQVQQLQQELQKAQQKQGQEAARAQADIAVSNAHASNQMQIDTAQAQNDMVLDTLKTQHGMQLQKAQAASKPRPQ